MAHLKQSTAYTRTFFLVSSTDHLSAKTGASPTVNISKAGGAYAAAGGAVTEIANGWYKVALTTTDTNTLGDLAYHITGTGSDDADFVDQVFAKTVDDLMSTFTLPANFSAFSLDASGRVDVGKVLGTAQTAGDLKASLNTLQADTDDIQTRLPAALVGGRMDSSVGAMATDVVTSGALAASAVQEIWDAATANLTTVGSIGKRLADDIDATISSRSTYAGADTAGTTTLLARLSAARALLLDNLSSLDAAITSRLAAAGYTAPDNASIAAIKTKTDSLTFTKAGEVDANTQSINDITITGNGGTNPFGV